MYRTPTANIRITTHELPFGRRYYTFEWIGPRNGIAHVDSRTHFRFSKSFPWRLKELPVPADVTYADVVRVDGLSWVPGWATVLRERTMEWVRMVKSRFIFTLMVWKLAYIPEGDVPSWKHVGRNDVT